MAVKNAIFAKLPTKMKRKLALQAYCRQFTYVLTVNWDKALLSFKLMLVFQFRVFMGQLENYIKELITNKFVSNHQQMKDNPFYIRKNIRLKTALHSSNSALAKTQINQSRKTLSVNKHHAKSIKSFKRIPTFENNFDTSERYSTNFLLSTAKLGLKSSKKFIPSRLKKNEIRSKLADKVISVNLNHLRLTTKSWCMYDQQQKKYFGFRQEHRREIASLTKIMTAIVSIQIMNKLMLSPMTLVKVTQQACACIGTTANLKKDHWISLENLLYGTMLPSGNDAAFSLAEYLGYAMSYSKKNDAKIGYFSYLQKMDLTKESTTLFTLEFIHQMNGLARRIGLLQTTFSNPHGLMNAMNISSAKDMLKLSIYACKNKLFKKIVNSKEHYYELIEQEGRKFIKKWENTNKLLEKGWQGVKTGMTASAGSCLSSIRQGIFIVVLNCSNHETRFSDSQKLFQWHRNAYRQCLMSKEEQYESKERLLSQKISIMDMASTDIDS